MGRADTKQRMIAGAVALLREQGVSGVTIDAVLARSGAPRGSVYHHFPGGRDELVRTAGQAAAEYITDTIRDLAAASGPTAVLTRFAEFWLTALETTDYRAGCPVVALTLGERPELVGVAELVRTTFAEWRTQLVEVLVSHGTPAPAAAARATVAVAAFEGALILCRAERSGEPLRQVTDYLIELFGTP